MNQNRVEQLKIFLADEPHDPFLRYTLALEYLKLERDAEALEILEKLLVENPDYLPTYYIIGNLYQKLQSNVEAIVTYEKGMVIAQEQKNDRTYRELKDALDNLMF
jgi:Tfp pilus assembly protein PilF